MKLELDAGSRLWRRRLGWLQWAVLEDVALSACPDSDPWTAPVGVRGVAQNLGMTKDTAARALSALQAAGLMTRVSVRLPDGKTRSGYQLSLPDGVTLSTASPARTVETKGADHDGDITGTEDSREHSVESDAPGRRSDREGVTRRSTGTQAGHRKRQSRSEPRDSEGRLFDPELL
jgi:hypothetical protein